MTPTAPVVRGARAAGALGLLAAVLAVLFTVAPVDQRTVDYIWDTRDGAVATPLALSAGQPVSLAATVGCRQLEGLPGGAGAVLSTSPDPGAAGPAPDGLWIGVRDGRAEVVAEGRTLWAAPVAKACPIDVVIDATGYRITGGSAAPAGGDGDVRPVLDGFFTELPVTAPTEGLSARIRADTRFESTPSAGKAALGVVVLVLVATSLGTLARVDRRSGRAHRVVGRLRLPRPRGPDLPVVAGLMLWTLIGPTTVDDGYTTTMVTDSARTGFVGGYHHWLNSPEAPFGSFYEPMRLWAGEDTALLWWRIPALLLGLLAWLLVSRLALPRLVPGARRIRWVPWLGAVAFLTGWLPFDVGLRSEPYVAAGFLAVWCLLDRALATRRSVVLILAVLVAGLTVTVAPTGLIAAALVLVAAPAVVRTFRIGRNGATFGIAGGLAGAAAVPLLVMFADQPLGAVRAGTAVRTAIGPNYPWQEEWRRYQGLFASPDVEGSMGRRVAVLLLLLAAVAVVVVLVRRRRIAGTNRGLTVRLLLATGAGLVVLALSPTKWTHHFGGFAGHLTLLVVLLAWIGHRTVRSASRRAVLLAAVSVVASLALSGAVTWWMSSSEGVSWWDIPPQLGGVRLADVALVVGLAWFALGVWLWGRPSAGIRAERWVPPVSLVLTVLLAGTLSLQTYGLLHAVVTTPGFSQQRSTAAALTGDGCGLAGSLRVEPEPAAGVLTPVPGPSGEPQLSGAVSAPVDRPAHASVEGLPPQLMWTVDGGRAGQLDSGWYVLPPEARTSGSPVVVEVGGSGDGTVAVEFGRSGPGGVDPVARVPLPLQERVDGENLLVSRVAPGADVVRVTARQESGPVENWLSVSVPRVPRTVPLAEMFPASTPALLDWPVAPLLPCQRLASLAGGAAEVPAFALTAGRDLPEAMNRGSGGPFAGIAEVYRIEPMPTYVEGSPETWEAQVLRIVPEQPTRPPIRIDGTVTAGGWSGRPAMR